jgi:putative flippase GtrA
MIKKELSVFLVVGISTVVVDYIFYQGMVALQWATIDIAKTFSFIVGTLYAYGANRFWTFSHKEAANNSALKFVLLYSVTLSANVLINSQLLEFLRNIDYEVQISFFFATGVSSTLNFIGMKFIIFKSIKEINDS